MRLTSPSAAASRSGFGRPVVVDLAGRRRRCRPVRRGRVACCAGGDDCRSAEARGRSHGGRRRRRRRRLQRRQSAAMLALPHQVLLSVMSRSVAEIVPVSATANAARRGQVRRTGAVDGERRSRAVARHVGEQVAAVVEVDPRPGSRSRGTGRRGARRSTDDLAVARRRRRRGGSAPDATSGAASTPSRRSRLLAPTSTFDVPTNAATNVVCGARRPRAACRPARGGRC